MAGSSRIIEGKSKINLTSENIEERETNLLQRKKAERRRESEREREEKEV